MSPAARRTILAAALVCAFASEIAAPAPAGPRRPPQVRVATTGNDSELVKTLPITRRSGARKRVVMSMRPAALGDLARGDRLRVTAELQVTVNCNYRSPRCVGPIYHYAPRVRAALVLARDARARGGRRALSLGRPERETCTQRRIDREHHCVLVFSSAGLTIGNPGRLPCPLDECFINLVADAHHPTAGRGDLLMVGGQRPDGRIPQDRGRINVVRYRDASARDFKTVTTKRRLHRRLRPDFRRRVVYSRRLDRLRDGEQLAVSASMKTRISQLRYAVRTSARLILASSPRAVRSSGFVKHHALVRGEIAENNGSNCTQRQGSCRYRKVGVLAMRRSSVDRRGRPLPLYVNLVTVLGPKRLEARARDRVRIGRRGGIEVRRFPPRVNG